MSTARELLEAAAGSPGGLEAFLERHAVTPQLATEVRGAFVRAAKAGHLETAELAASVASLLWLRLGNTHEGFRNAIDRLQVGFQLAQDAAAYLDVRTRALEVLSRLRSLNEEEFSFRAAVLAADAGYFGHRAGGDRVGLSVPVILADLASASNYARWLVSSTWFPRFVELLAVTVQAAMSKQLEIIEQEQVDRSLRHLAADVRSILPSIRCFPESSAKATEIDRVLTLLVGRYGQ